MPIPYAILVLCALLVFGWNNAVIAEEWAAAFDYYQYEVESQVPVEKIGPGLRQLPELAKDMAAILELPLEDQPIQIKIFSSQWNYRRYVGARVPEAANRPAVFVKAPDMLYVFITYGSNWERDLRHEVCHAHLHATLPYLPMWIDEGLAKYFEVPSATAGMQKDYVGNLIWRFRFRQQIRTEKLEQIDRIADMKPEHYRDSWAWVYFCLHYSAETRLLLQNYLQAIQREEIVGSLIDRIQQTVPNTAQTTEHFFRKL